MAIFVTFCDQNRHSCRKNSRFLALLDWRGFRIAALGERERKSASLLFFRIFLFPVLVVCCAIPVSAFAQDSAMPLVQVFCSELEHYSHTSPSQPLADDQWRELVSRLEKREALAAEASSTGLDDCLREHRQEFERAEFILRGKQLLAEAIRDFKKSPDVVPAPPVESPVMGILGMVEVHLESPELAGMTSSEWLTETKSREGHYDELWHGFLDELRRELARASSILRHTADVEN